MKQRLLRVLPARGRTISFRIDDEPAEAIEGESLLAAILCHRDSLPGAGVHGARAGFCLMGACQECWVQVEGMGPVRTCTTPVGEGMRVAAHRSAAPATEDE